MTTTWQRSTPSRLWRVVTALCQRRMTRRCWCGSGTPTFPSSGYRSQLCTPCRQSRFIPLVRNMPSPTLSLPHGAVSHVVRLWVVCRQVLWVPKHGQQCGGVRRGEQVPAYQEEVHWAQRGWLCMPGRLLSRRKVRCFAVVRVLVVAGGYWATMHCMHSSVGHAIALTCRWLPGLRCLVTATVGCFSGTGAPPRCTASCAHTTRALASAPSGIPSSPVVWLRAAGMV